MSAPTPATRVFRIASLVVPSWLAWYVTFTTTHVDAWSSAVSLVLGPLWALVLVGLVVRAVAARLAGHTSAAARLDQIDVLTSSGCALAWTSSLAIVGAVTLGWVSLSVVGLLGTALLHLVILHTMVAARPGATLRGGSLSRRFCPATPREGDEVVEELRIVDVQVPVGFRLFVSGRVGRRWATVRHAVDASDAGGEVLLESKIGPAVRGEHEPEPLTVWLEDTFGLCRAPCPPLEAPKLVVLPRERRVDRAAPLLGHGVGASVARVTPRAPTEGHLDLREYREGDDIRRVHWVRSLVAGELVVRVPDEVPPDQPRVRLVLDTYFPEAKWLASDAPAELLDGLVATWLALGRALVEAGYRVSLVAAAPHGETVAPVRRELTARAPGPALRLGAQVTWQGVVDVDQLLTDERTIVVARAVISRADATHRARWVLVHGEVSDARSLDGAPVRLPFPAGAPDNRVGLRRRVSLELSRETRDRALTLRAARMNFAPPPPGSIAAYPVRGDGLIRLEALS